MRLLPVGHEGLVYAGPTPGGAWIDAADLLPGDRLLQADGGWAEVVSIAVEDAPLLAWNMNVATTDSYFVTQGLEDDAVWVHNCKKDEPDTPPSTKSRIRDAQLPNSGRIRYIPPKNYKPTNPLPRGDRNGYLDKFGNEWTRGPSRTQGQSFEWDVQLSPAGKKQLGWASKGDHLNVSLDGHITH